MQFWTNHDGKFPAERWIGAAGWDFFALRGRMEVLRIPAMAERIWEGEKARFFDIDTAVCYNTWHGNDQAFLNFRLRKRERIIILWNK
jgi:hypothetical protein